jgi:hypothetical protein
MHAWFRARTEERNFQKAIVMSVLFLLGCAMAALLSLDLITAPR